MNYHDLIHFYSRIIKELNIKVIIKNNDTYIENVTCNYGRFVLLNKDFFGFNHLSRYEMHFNPLSNNKNECSVLIMKDAIYKKIEHNIKKKFNVVVRQLCSDKKLNYDFMRNKFLYVFKTVDVPFSRSIIEFKYTVSKDDCKVILQYPLYNFISTQNKNIIFGVHLEDCELEIFKYAYKSIIDMINEGFQYIFKIPSTSNLFTEFYVMMKIYFKINEYFRTHFSEKYRDIEISLDELNIFNFDSYSFDDDILQRNGRQKYTDYINRIIENEKKQYQAELKKRESYQIDWLFKKDNIMVKEKNTLITRDEIDKKFNNLYWTDYIKKISSFQANIDIQKYISDTNYRNNNKDYVELLDIQKLALDIINAEDSRLFFDMQLKKYYFRSTNKDTFDDYNKDDMTNILNNVLQQNLPKYHTIDTNSAKHIIEVALIESINDISKQKLKDEFNANNVQKVLIFTNAIPTINGNVFDITRKEEIFQSETDLLFKRNRFIPTKHLAKRTLLMSNSSNRKTIAAKQTPEIFNLDETITAKRITQPFIISFIKSMVNNDTDKTNYIINWLAAYFQKLKKTDIALVLFGEQEVTQTLFWDIIIQEIFGESYCVSMIDECDSTLITDIAQDKLFFNIGDIDDSASKFTDKIIATTIEELLFRDKVTNENNEDIVIHGQILITSSNPAPYLNELLSSCTVININNIDKIKEDLDVEDKMELKRKIKNDLDLFTDYLNNYSVDEELATNYLKTEERLLLKGKATANIDEDDRNKKIDIFINAIKNRDLDYFKNVKDTKDNKGKNIYEQLKNTFEKDEGYFILNDLSLYFNAIYSDYNFKNNTTLLDLLKEKDDMFNQQYIKLTILDKDGNNEVLFEKYSSSGLGISTKNLLKINGYKLPEEFTIKAGWFAETNDNSFKKYIYEDIESSKKARQLAREKDIIK